MIAAQGAVIALLVLVPQVAAAQTVQDIISMIGRVLNALMPLAIGIALLVFMWGIVRFMASAGNERAREVGRNFMFWGVIGLFLMVSVWGIVEILSGVFGADIGGEVEPPFLDI